MDKKRLINEIKRFYEVVDLFNGISKDIFKLSKYGEDVSEFEIQCNRSKNKFLNKHFDFMNTISKEDILSLGGDIRQIPIGWLFDYAKVTGVFNEDEIFSLYKK